MLLLESKNLVVGFVRDALALVRCVVHLLHSVDCASNLTLVALVYTRLVALLLPPDVDLLAELLVLCLEIIELYKALI